MWALLSLSILSGRRERDQNSVSPRITPLLNGSLTQLEDVEEGSISGDCEDDCMKKWGQNKEFKNGWCGGADFW